jgi:hypothetical protein
LSQFCSGFNGFNDKGDEPPPLASGIAAGQIRSFFELMENVAASLIGLFFCTSPWLFFHETGSIRRICFGWWI